jgi:hypothetical protein
MPPMLWFLLGASTVSTLCGCCLLCPPRISHSIVELIIKDDEDCRE